MLRFKTRRFNLCTDYYENGQGVATYDPGPGYFYFSDGKEFNFSRWNEDLVEDRIYPKGKAKIACIIDWNYESISDEESADRIIDDGHGVITYYREGEPTVVAYSETPVDQNSHCIIGCSGIRYDCTFERNSYWRLARTALAKISDNGHLVGQVSEFDSIFYFRGKSHFLIDLPLTERVFITLLAYPWF